MGKVWVLDTETKGTGANMVPLEKVLERPEPAEQRPKRAKRAGAKHAEAKHSGAERSADGETPAATRAPRRPKPEPERTATALPPGHVRKKATGEIGKVQSVDAKAGTATVRWLKRGATSTVPLSAIARR